MTIGRVALATLLAGCLPLHETIHNHDTVLATHDVDSGRAAPVLEVKADTSAEGLTLVAESTVACTRESQQTVRRVQENEERTNHVVHGLLYVVGLAAASFGGATIYDSENSNGPSDRAIQIGSTLDASLDAGIAIAAVGGAMLLYAIGSSFHAIDSTEQVGNIELPVAGSRHIAECDRAPAKAQSFGLVFAREGGPRQYVPLGQTDAQGHLVTPWSTISARLDPTVDGAGSVVAGAPDEVAAMLAHNGTIAALATVTPPDFTDPEKGWALALRVATADGFRAYGKRFPTSPHAAEAADRTRAFVAAKATLDFEAALAASELDKAAHALDDMRAGSDPAAVASAQARLETARHAVRVKQAREQMPKLLADVDATADPATAIASAKAAIEDLRADAPDEAAADDAQLDDARKRVTVRLIAEGQAAFGKRDFAGGTKRFDVAVTTTKDVPAVEKARQAALAAAVRASHDEARGLARSAKYADAIAILDALIAIAPNDGSLAADRARWDDAAKRVAQAASEQQARAERQEAARIAREQAAEAARVAHEEELAKQAVAKAATEQALRDRAAAQQAAREDKARAAAEQKLRDDAERKRRADELAVAEAQRKQEVEAAKAKQREIQVAQQAEAKRLADEAARKADDAKRAADDAKKAELAARKAAQWAKEHPGEMPVAPAPPPPSTGFVTVQYELAARYAKEDVLKSVRIPGACQESLTAFVARSPACKDAECKPVPMSRAEITCGAQMFSFVQEATHIWLTCGVAASTCNDCVAAGQTALATSVVKNTAKLAQGCK